MTVKLPFDVRTIERPFRIADPNDVSPAQLARYNEVLSMALFEVGYHRALRPHVVNGVDSFVVIKGTVPTSDLTRAARLACDAAGVPIVLTGDAPDEMWREA